MSFPFNPSQKHAKHIFGLEIFLFSSSEIGSWAQETVHDGLPKNPMKNQQNSAQNFYSQANDLM